MNITRRTFLKSSSIFLGGLAIQGHKSFSNFEDENKKGLKIIRDKVGIFTEKGGTIGWFADNDNIVVIDSQFPDSAKNFMDQFSQKNIGQIDYLFNTHHHRDHTMGNFYLQKFVSKIIAHENCPRLQIKQNKGSETESQVVTAGITFKERMNVELINENISAIHFGQAHTGGDSIIHLENSNIAHLGDLVFNKVYPYIDNSGECSVENWIKVLEKVLNHFNNETIFIFGHAADNDLVIGTKDDIILKKGYLETLFTFVQKEVNSGKTLEEISNSETLPGYENLKESWPGAKKMNFKATAEQII